MKLSNMEQHIIEMAQMPRSIIHDATLLLLEQYGFKISKHHVYKLSNSSKALCKLVECYIKNCTTDLETCLKEISIECEANPKDVLKMLTTDFQTSTSLDKFKIESPEMLLRRIAYLCCIHGKEMANKLSLIGINSNNELFYPMLETIHFFCVYPRSLISQNDLSLVLSYRLGISSDDILKLFMVSIEKEIPENKKKHLLNYTNKTFLGVCYTLATHRSNFPLVG